MLDRKPMKGLKDWCDMGRPPRIDIKYLLMEMVDLKSIEDAAKRIKVHVHLTPVMTSGMIDKMIPGRNLFFKCELLQKTGSFKIRGALNAVSKFVEHVEGIAEDQKKPKVVTTSSGNFGQGLAYAAKLNSLDAHIVMPENAPQCKVNAVKGYGAEVITCKPTEEKRWSDDKILFGSRHVYSIGRVEQMILDPRSCHLILYSTRCTHDEI
nr:serine racemase-like [Lytechinus pictus]